MTRKEILDTAAKCVCGDREQDYGSPENNFQIIADLWNAYIGAEIVRSWDVATMLALLKVARISSGHAKEDNWVDLAGYAACGGEIQSKATGAKAKKPSYTSYGDTSYTAEALRHYECQQRQRKTNTAEKKEYYPCVVWVYDDDSFDWDLLPTFCHANYDKTVVACHTDCTVQVLEYSDGHKKSLGWWRSEQPPVKCCGDKDEVQDDDCN
jgi:hypothetical protein